jgi:hypothetical protein
MPVEERPTSLRQHTSAYVRIRPHTSAYVSIRQHTSAYEMMRGVGRNHQHDPHFYPPFKRLTNLLPFQDVTNCAQCCGYQDLAKLLTKSPCVMTAEILEIQQLVQSPAKVGQAIGNQNQLGPRPGQSEGDIIQSLSQACLLCKKLKILNEKKKSALNG